MKKEDIKIGIKEIQNIKMNSKEKEHILENVLSFSYEKKEPVKSPYSFISIFQKNHFIYYGSMACLVLILGSSGVIFSSQKSLPGNTLYPLKVSVLEPINSAFRLSPETKAQYESSLVKERILEAETLSYQGKLDVAKEQQINDLIKTHKVAFSRAINEIKLQEPTEEIYAVATNLEDQMAEYSQEMMAISTSDTENQYSNEIAKLDVEKIPVTNENTENNIEEKKGNIGNDNSKVATINPTVSMPTATSTSSPVNSNNNNGNTQKYINIASSTFDTYFQKLSLENGNTFDYKISNIDFVALKNTTDEPEKYWFKEDNTDESFIVIVNYSVQTNTEGKNYWLAGNGTEGENGWILNKVLFVNIDKNSEGYYVKSAGTGP